MLATSALTALTIIPNQQHNIFASLQTQQSHSHFRPLSFAFFSCLECPRYLLFIPSWILIHYSNGDLSVLPLLATWSNNTILISQLIYMWTFEICVWILRGVSACVDIQAFYLRRVLPVMNLSHMTQCEK